MVSTSNKKPDPGGQALRNEQVLGSDPVQAIESRLLCWKYETAHTRDGQNAEHSQQTAKQQDRRRRLWHGLSLANRVSIAAASYVSALRQEDPIGELCATGASEVEAELQVIPYCAQRRQSAAADDAHRARDRRITAAPSDAVARLSDVDGVDARIGESRPVLSNCEVAKSRSDIVLIPE